MERIRHRLLTLALLAALVGACGSPAADPAADNGDNGEPAQSVEVQEPAPTPTEAAPMQEPTEAPAVPDIDPFTEGLSGGNTDAFPYPATDDAFGFSSLGGLVSYMTYYDLDELVTLYQAAMPMLGYEPNSDTVIPGMAVLSYAGNGVALTVNVSTNDDGTNKVSILTGTLQ